MRIFDCHSHWATEKGYLFRTPEALASQERIWKTKPEYLTEQQMADYFRKNNVRAILDMAWINRLPIEEMATYHDYAFDVQRGHSDAIFGHWINIDPRVGKAGVREFERCLAAKAGFVGFGVFGQGFGLPPSEPIWDPFYKVSIDAGVPVLIHTGLTGIGQGERGGGGLIVDHAHPRHVDIVAAKFPDLNILAARPSYPWQEDMIAVMLHKANVQYELHGWSPKYLSDSLKKEIGSRLQDRVMFGCDFPVLKYEKLVADWHTLGYKPEILEKVFYKNAEAYFPERKRNDAALRTLVPPGLLHFHRLGCFLSRLSAARCVRAHGLQMACRAHSRASESTISEHHESGLEKQFLPQAMERGGPEPGDIRSLDDITKIPTFTSEDIKNDQLEHPPFGEIHGNYREYFGHQPVKLLTSGGTTGKPRATLYGPIEWAMNGLNGARTLYLLGARPGDVAQIPATNSLANIGWSFYKACHDYMGILPLTTGSGVVTGSRRQIEYAFEWGTNIWTTFPEYLMQLAKVAREELNRDVRDLKTKMILTFLGPDLDNSLRKELEALWGCDVYDLYGTHEMGGGAAECREKNGMHLSEDGMYFEVLDTETDQPVPKGQAGNLTVTIFYRELLPLIRYNVRDLGRILYDDRCACGSSFRRMDKFLGRSDDMVKLRGVNLYPMACLPAVKSDSRTTGEWFCIVDRFTREGVIRDEMTVKVEVRKDAGPTDGLREHLERRLQTDLGVKVAVELVADASLAPLTNLGREGKAKRLQDRRFAKKS